MFRSCRLFDLTSCKPLFSVFNDKILISDFIHSFLFSSAYSVFIHSSIILLSSFCVLDTQRTKHSLCTHEAYILWRHSLSLCRSYLSATLEVCRGDMFSVYCLPLLPVFLRPRLLQGRREKQGHVSSPDWMRLAILFILVCNFCSISSSLGSVRRNNGSIKSC